MVWNIFSLYENEKVEPEPSIHNIAKVGYKSKSWLNRGLLICSMYVHLIHMYISQKTYFRSFN